MAQRQVASYLTPVQRITEESLAPERLLDESMRVEQAVRNPLVETGPQVVSAVPETIPAPQSNPFIRPPVPLSVMGTDQRIAWQELQDEQEKNQMARDAALLQAEENRRKMEQQREEIRQSSSLMGEVPKLQEAISKGDVDQYHALRADLVRTHPVGVGSPEATRVLKYFDDIITKKEGIEAEINKARIAREENAKQTQANVALKVAAQHGGHVVSRVAAELADPVNGLDNANKILAQEEQRSLVQGLRDQNISDEEIARRYGTGESFNYQAARNAPKSALSLLRERKQARADLSAIQKARDDSRFDPARAQRTGKDPYANTTWTQDQEDAYDEARQLVNELAPKNGDNRAGVQGMATKYVPYERTLNPAARVTAAVPPPAQVPATAAPREKTYRNPATGKRIALRNGKWEEI